MHDKTLEYWPGTDPWAPNSRGGALVRARWAVASAEGVLVAMLRPASCWIGRLWLEPIDEVQIEAAELRKEEKDEGVACGSVVAEEEEEEVKERVLSAAEEEEGMEEGRLPAAAEGVEEVFFIFLFL